MENSKKHLIQLDMEKEIAHGIDVSNLAYCVADELNLPKEECYELAVAGMLHDIGKLEVAKYVYSQEDDTLTIEEMKYVRSHSQLGYEILKEQGYSPYILDCILHHHENYDGTGYPFNLEEDEIPLSARILRVCDVFAALTSERPYRTSFGRGCD